MNQWSSARSNFKQTASMVLTVGLLIGCAPGFEADFSEATRPPASSDPLTAEDQRRWEAAERSEVRVAPVLESEFERESFLGDLTEQKPKHTEDELAEEAEKSFVAKSKPANSTQDNDNADSKKSPTKPLPPQPSVRSDFCDSLNVTSAKAKPDISHLYNSTTPTATTAMPSKELAAADPQEKKNRFVCLVLPMAVRMNEEVYRMRIEVLRLQAKSKRSVALSKSDVEWLTDMNKTYGVKEVGNFEELLKRVDIIPLPLLLAQAAIESGWGTSRATNDLKNIFGIHAVRNQKCKVGYDTNNACVRQFDTLEASVSAYIQLINSGMHYHKFRDARTSMRKGGEILDSVKLLATLGKYNETPVQYIRNVREIMTGSNKLTQFVFKEEEVNLKAP